LKPFFDYLIVGAGFAGSVAAERLASQLGKKILLVDKRNHTGGNSHDRYNEDGLLVHAYGAHVFHTDCDDVWNYVTSFARFNNYRHRVLAFVDGKYVPIPINRTTVNTLLGVDMDEAGIKAYFDGVSVKLAGINNSRDVVVSKVGEFFYEKFFRNYTYKQWGVYPESLSPEVTGRIPVRFDAQDGYFQDRHQGLPAEGYFKLFDKMLAHKNITIALNTDYKDIIEDVTFDRIICTCPIDYFFDYKHGKLPYRSQRFEFETLDVEFHQEAAVINYPNDHAFTKVTEAKHMTFQKHSKTTIVREYPAAEGEPYYPVPMREARELYEKYRADADRIKSVRFVGRLAQYRYYNMDQAVKKSLELVGEIAGG
jgi:UDP-galactopyranose mutase